MNNESSSSNSDTVTDLEPILTSWLLRDIPRGYRNYQHLQQSLGEKGASDLEPILTRLLPRCSDPDMALNNLERFLSNQRGQELFPCFLEPRSRTPETLLQLFCTSQFISDSLINEPDFLEMIRIPLRNSPSRNELLNQLQQDVQSAFDDAGVLRAFRRFRQRQMIRIGTNDIIRDRPLEEITKDISRVADCALETALETAMFTMQKRYGDPFSETGKPSRVVILAFGKHGGQELNYSSDIDLMVIYDVEGYTKGLKFHSLANAEFFAKVTSEIVRLLSSHTENGQAYRIDLRLRPEGNRGPLARSMKSTLAYYDTMGRTWERQALIKIRPVAGDKKLGDEFIKSIEPFVYRKYLSFAEINEIKALKRRIEHKTHQQGNTETEVKTGHGGIRDVEFTIQFLQLLNGGDLPELRQSNTLKALEALEEVGCLTHQEYQILDNTYRFLRKIEHRLQMMFDLQTHRIPDSEEQRERLSLNLGFGCPTSKDRAEEDENRKKAVELFFREYKEKTELNRRILDHLLHEAFMDGSQQAEPETDLVLDPNPSEEFIQEVLGRYPFRDITTAYQNLMHLAQESVPILSTRRCRHFLASIAPHLLRAVSETPDPDMALTNLEKVSASLGGKGVLWELFSFSPQTLKLYVDLCSGSQFLSQILINNPGMIDELLDSLLLDQPRTRLELQEELTDLCRHAEDTDLILHSFLDKELLRIGVRDILGRDTLRETTAALSDLAETILGQLAVLQQPPLHKRFGLPFLEGADKPETVARFVILGLGKLGGREMSYHSDLDLIIIYEGNGETGLPKPHSRFDRFEKVPNHRFFAEVAKTIIREASSMGPRGRLYEVDMRLRPTGKSGNLVISLHDFEKYYQSGSAQLWERQALTRARVVHGDEEFGKQVMSTLTHVIYDVTWQPEMADEIANMREKVQASGTSRDLKRGYGGIIDIEFLVQLYRLKYGPTMPELRVTNTWDTLDSLEKTKLISGDEYQKLSDSHNFLRLVESKLRVLYNRSLDELPSQQEELEKLAKSLHCEANEDKTATEVFLDRLDYHLNQTRELFLQLMEREKGGEGGQQSRT